MGESAELKLIVEAALLAAGRPMSLDALLGLFDEEQLPERKRLRQALEQLQEDYAGRGIEVREVASGWRVQVRREFAPWISRLWEEKPGRYSRATMETLALIAYRQPITRGEIEDVRGVSVNTNTIKTLVEREWIRVVGHRDVPGKPALYATTREFLDYFDLKGLDDLPSLAEIRDLDDINCELNLLEPDQNQPVSNAGSDLSSEVQSERGTKPSVDVSHEAHEASAEGPRGADNAAALEVSKTDTPEGVAAETANVPAAAEDAGSGRVQPVPDEPPQDEAVAARPPNIDR